MDDLRSWLEKTGLSGRPLQLALDSCEMNCIETIDDLRLTAENESEFKEIFPQGGIRVRISAALADPTSVSSPRISKPKENPRADESAKTTYGQDKEGSTPTPQEKVESAQELPEGKL